MADQKNINPIYKIMVIEDEKLLLQAIEAKMKKMGYDVVACISGKEALQHLSKTDVLPDAIWLDYYLPDTNGIEFASKLKESPKWDKIPVMVVSNSASIEKINSLIGLGIKKYFLKAEHRLDELVNEIITFIQEQGNNNK